MITGKTKLIAHIGYPTETFKSPMIYNPYFEDRGIDVLVVPMGVKVGDYENVLKATFSLTNIVGALITMPHKVTTVGLLDEVSTKVKIAGACNAVRRREDGKLVGDMFDGEGFVRGLASKGKQIKGSRAYVLGSGGVGSAIVASLAGAGVSALSLKDFNPASAQALADRIRANYPQIEVTAGSDDLKGYDIVVNATPIGMKDDDPLPFDMDRISADVFVGEVVMKQAHTPFLRAAIAKGCAVQLGTDMLFEQIPAYLEFFGLPSTTSAELRRLAKISY
ncbi:MAG: shikimate dehydrogenase [Hyphomicrobiales bacterium]|nr:shikimate dehydrogenase [Hyphomicrobiales bacterium]MDE2113646.1 shikimate dehydrogenase [Hyphomicrobiales bacterium]